MRRLPTQAGVTGRMSAAGWFTGTHVPAFGIRGRRPRRSSKPRRSPAAAILPFTTSLLGEKRFENVPNNRSRPGGRTATVAGHGRGSFIETSRPDKEVRAGMNPPSQTNVRHAIRPLSVFSFCGQFIAAPYDHHAAPKDLPLCPDCKRYRDKAALLFGGRRRRRD